MSQAQKTYCEVINEQRVPDRLSELPAECKIGKSVNWPVLLHILKTDPSPHLLDIAGDLSSNWVTCACGNQCSELPRNEDGAPADLVLLTLGVNFMQRLSRAAFRPEEDQTPFQPHVAEHIIAAEAILHDIELRAAALLKELNS